MEIKKVKKIIFAVFPIFFYLLLALILTYPLITRFSTYIPGTDGDSYIYLYTQWWFKNALTNGLDLFSSPLLLFPYGADLSLSVTTISNNIIISFFNLFLPAVVSFNLFVILSFTVAAWGMFILLRYLIKNKTASLLGGFIFSFHPYVFYKLGEGHFNYSSVYFIPFFVLFLLKAASGKTRKYLNASLAALFLLISFYNDLYYTYALFFILILYFFWLWYYDQKNIIKNIKIFLIIILVFTAFAWPLGLRIMKASVSGDYPFATNEQISLYSPDIRSFFIPSPLSIFSGDTLFAYYQKIKPHDTVIFIGYILIFLTIFGYYINSHYKKDFSLGFWRLLSIFFLFLSLGPVLFIGGVKLIPLPYQLLYFFPFFNGILVPPRLIIFFIFSLIIPAAYGFKIIINKINNRYYKSIVIASIFSLVFFEYFPAPIPVIKTSIPEFYKKLSLEDSNYTILELPFALSTSFYTLGDINSSSKLQYSQTIHHKPILGGYVSRVPYYVRNYYRNLEALRYLISPGKLTSAKITSSEKDLVKKTFSDLKIGYIIIHPEYYISLEYNKHQDLINTTYYLDQIFGSHFREDGLLIYDLKSK